MLLRSCVCARVALACLPLLLALLPLTAQEFSIGVIGGSNLNGHISPRPYRAFTGGDPVQSVSISSRINAFSPKIGPKFEIDFLNNWSAETGILVQRSVATSTVRWDPPLFIAPDRPPIAQQTERYDEAIFEIPVLVKRRVPLGRADLILEGGPSFRPFGGFDGPGKAGITAGVGTRFTVGHVRWQPTIRYTRWQASDSRERFRQDELSVLLEADIRSSLHGHGDAHAPLSAGFIGGTTLTKDFPEKQGYAGVTSRMAGVALEYQFTGKWGAEADVIYHPLILSERARATVITWEIPFLAKYRFRHAGSIRPFVTAGPSFRSSGNRNSTNPSIVGATTGAGVEWRHGRFSISPALRYSRWQQDAPSERSPATSNKNQLHALVSIRFGGR